MTLTSTTVRSTALGDGATVTFPYTFRIFDATDLVVLVRTAAGTETVLTYPTDYTVSGVGNTSGGSVTCTTAPADGSTVVLLRATPHTQGASIRNQGTFYPETHETAWDKQVAQGQQLKDQVERAVRLARSYDPADYELEVAPGSAGQALMWQAGDALGWQTLDANAVALPGEGRTVATLTNYLYHNRVFHVDDFLPTTGYVAGTTDARAYIIAACDAAKAAGGGIVQLGAATYAIGFATHRTAPSLTVGIEVPGNVWLRGLGKGVTTLKLLASQANQGRMIENTNPNGYTDEDLWLSDFTIDGNKANQNPAVVDRQFGIATTRVTRLVVRNVRVTGIFGTTAGGNGPNGTNGEGFAIAPVFAKDFLIENCDGDDGASGIGPNGSASSGASGEFPEKGRIVGCRSRNAQFNAFTLYQCDDVVYENCHVYNSGYHGFNCEDNRNVRYIGCTAQAGPSTQAGAYAFPSYAGAYGTQHIGCTARGYTASGFGYLAVGTSQWLDTSGTRVTVGFATGTHGCVIVGGSALANSAYGVLQQAGTGLLRGILPSATGNTSGDYSLSNSAGFMVQAEDGLLLSNNLPIKSMNAAGTAWRELTYISTNDDLVTRIPAASKVAQIRNHANSVAYSFGNEGVVYALNCSSVPVSNPPTGGYLYVEAGALKYRGSGGTVTTIAPA